MLPAAFQFERHLDGPGLFLGDRAVAFACRANYEPDSPWRLCLNPTGLPRYVFTRTEGGSVRYMEAWAEKWETEIRDAVGRTGSGMEHLQHRGDITPDTHHPRRRSRRMPTIAR